jgi:hypothetical protein
MFQSLSNQWCTARIQSSGKANGDVRSLGTADSFAATSNRHDAERIDTNRKMSNYGMQDPQRAG